MIASLELRLASGLDFFIELNDVFASVLIVGV